MTCAARASASVSVEPDYLSISGGLSPSWKLDDDHVTLAVSYALGHDTIGRAGTPFSVFHPTLLRHQMAAGASFVLSPSSLLWLGADVVVERGDQSKPYRYVPMCRCEMNSASMNDVDSSPRCKRTSS